MTSTRLRRRIIAVTFRTASTTLNLVQWQDFQPLQEAGQTPLVWPAYLLRVCSFPETLAIRVPGAASCLRFAAVILASGTSLDDRQRVKTMKNAGTVEVYAAADGTSMVRRCATGDDPRPPGAYPLS
jgi:hypothetical protein